LVFTILASAEEDTRPPWERLHELAEPDHEAIEQAASPSAPEAAADEAAPADGGKPAKQAKEKKAREKKPKEPKPAKEPRTQKPRKPSKAEQKAARQAAQAEQPETEQPAPVEPVRAQEQPKPTEPVKAQEEQPAPVEPVRAQEEQSAPAEPVRAEEQPEPVRVQEPPKPMEPAKAQEQPKPVKPVKAQEPPKPAEPTEAAAPAGDESAGPAPAKAKRESPPKEPKEPKERKAAYAGLGELLPSNPHAGIRGGIGISGFAGHDARLIGAPAGDKFITVRINPSLAAVIGFAYAGDINDLLGVTCEVQYAYYSAYGATVPETHRDSAFWNVYEAGVELHALEFPILLRVNPGALYGVPLYAEAGPQFGINMSGRLDDVDGNIRKPNLNGFAIGLTIGAGATVSGVDVGLRAHFGFLEYAKGTRGKPCAVTLNVTSYFK
jgi:hypothetical protein